MSAEPVTKPDGHTGLPLHAVPAGPESLWRLKNIFIWPPTKVFTSDSPTKEVKTFTGRPIKMAKRPYFPLRNGPGGQRLRLCDKLGKLLIPPSFGAYR